MTEETGTGWARPQEPESRRSSSLPLVVELLGWTGGALVALALLALVDASWEQLSAWGRPLLTGVVAGLTGAGGWLIDGRDPAARRLATVCGGLSSVAGVLTVGLVVDAAFAGDFAAPVLAASVAAFSAAAVARDRVRGLLVALLETVALASAATAAASVCALLELPAVTYAWTVFGVTAGWSVVGTTWPVLLRYPGFATTLAAAVALLPGGYLAWEAGLAGPVALTALGVWCLAEALRRTRWVLGGVGVLALLTGVPRMLAEAGVEIEMWSATLLVGSTMVLAAGLLARRARGGTSTG